MRKILLLRISILLTCCIQCQSERKGVENDLVKRNLNGVVKSVKSFMYIQNHRTGKSNYVNSTSFFFNKRGFIEKSVIYNNDNKISKTSEYIYDSIDNLILEVTKFSEFAVLDSAFSTYNEEGKVDKTLIYRKHENKTYLITKSFHYGDSGNLISEHVTSPVTGIFKANETYTSYSYSKDGRLQGSKLYEIIDELKVKSRDISYGSNGLIVTQEEFNKRIGKIWDKLEFKYDKNDNIIEASQIKYDDGNIESKFSLKNFYYFNNDNLMERQESYDFDDILISSISYQYKQDKQGNWIEKISKNNDKLHKTITKVKREIEYY